MNYIYVVANGRKERQIICRKNTLHLFTMFNPPIPR